MAGRTLVVPPAAEPITLDEAKVFARISTTAEDALVASLITAARKRCEEWRGQAFLTQTWDYFLDYFPGWWDGYTRDIAFTPTSAGSLGGYPNLVGRRALPITLPRAPLQSVTWVKYTPYNGSPLTLDPATYQIDVSNTLAPRVLPNIDRLWPTDLLQSLNGVNVRFVAGYGTSLPEHMTLALKQLVAFWYFNRDAVGTIPESVDALLADVTGGFTYA